MTHPNPELPPFVTVAGELWHLYYVPFKHDSTRWEFLIYARCDAEAAAMVASIRASAEQPARIVQIDRMASYN